MKQDNMLAMILAGGRGTRLHAEGLLAESLGLPALLAPDALRQADA